MTLSLVWPDGSVFLWLGSDWPERATWKSFLPVWTKETTTGTTGILMRIVGRPARPFYPGEGSGEQGSLGLQQQQAGLEEQHVVYRKGQSRWHFLQRFRSFIVWTPVCGGQHVVICHGVLGWRSQRREQPGEEGQQDGESLTGQVEDGGRRIRINWTASWKTPPLIYYCYLLPYCWSCCEFLYLYVYFSCCCDTMNFLSGI